MRRLAIALAAMLALAGCSSVSTEEYAAVKPTFDIREYLNGDLEAWGVLINRDKNPLFTVEERVEMLQESVKDCKNVTVKTFDGRTVDFARTNHAQVAIRIAFATVITLSPTKSVPRPHCAASNQVTENGIGFCQIEFCRSGASSARIRPCVAAGPSGCH